VSRPQLRQEFSKFSWRSGQNCKPWDAACDCAGSVARRARTYKSRRRRVSKPPALQAGGHRFDPDHVHQRYSQTRIMTADALAKAFEFLGVTGMHCSRHRLCARWRFCEMNCQDLQPISDRIFARTSASSAADILPLCLARLFRQSRLLTWSARTALGLAPAITTSKG
jgi:hypothetical protein